jgi:hypothetical protein
MLNRWQKLKLRLAPYGKILSTGYGAFLAIEQLQHPTIHLAAWMLWTGAVVTSLLFVFSIIERLPSLTVMFYDAMKKDRESV